VFEIFLQEYAAGRTPNPDILCNKEIKFNAFLNYALSQGADYIAMGHYAQIHCHNSQYSLVKGKDPNKDQSYFLYTLNQNQLAHSLFPIGHLQKHEVRALAKKIGLDNHAKKDSTGICFIGERPFKEFLSGYLPANPGPITTPEGQSMGEHQGLMYYTLGQRKGIGIGGQQQAKEAPWYVLAKNLSTNTLIIGQDHDHPLLLSKHLTCQSIHWIGAEPIQYPLQCQAKIRYRQASQDCFLEKNDQQNYHVTFATPQRGITPGQSVVFYHDATCLGGSIIDGSYA